MNRRMNLLLALTCAGITGIVRAADPPPPVTPGVTLTASATASVPNDRMYAWLRVEVDNPDPARAAAEVNTKMAKALARAKGTAGVEVTTSGYSSYQVTDKNQPSRWRVTQSLSLEGSDFATMAALVSKLQADDLLLLSGMNFAVSTDTRRKTEDALTQQAIKAWQARAQNAARGFGYDTWRTGKVTIQTGDYMRPQPLMRMAASMAGGGAPPVNVEGGNTDVTVSVNGEAILDAPRPR
ncbi:MAG: SIMPL domain-containing protein [Casimicrobiaceae bacterium]